MTGLNPVNTSAGVVQQKNNDLCNDMKAQALPDTVAAAVLAPSQPVTGYPVVEGPDFNNPEISKSLSALLQSYSKIGFQATNMGRAIEIINEMLQSRVTNPNLHDSSKEKEQIDENVNENDSEEEDEKGPRGPCKIYLGYTSNMISSGQREVIRFLAQHKLVDVIVTTAGGVEEDIIKCLADTYVADFRVATGEELRGRGVNRIGNLLVPNDNYCLFESWIMPILDECVDEQEKWDLERHAARIDAKKAGRENELDAASGALWTPSRLIRRLGERINDERSVYYWCARNNIPVFCPALTDGSLGDMIYFHSYRRNGLVLDLVGDIRALNNTATYALNTGMIILGAGVVKHHICNANLMRNGADYAVFINTAHEYDGSDAGAQPDEAVSWGKLRRRAKAVKLHADATLVFPLLAAATFAPHVHDVVKAQLD